MEECKNKVPTEWNPIAGRNRRPCGFLAPKLKHRERATRHRTYYRGERALASVFEFPTQRLPRQKTETLNEENHIYKRALGH
jgi:hypothetical protein